MVLPAKTHVHVGMDVINNLIYYVHDVGYCILDAKPKQDITCGLAGAFHHDNHWY